MTKKQSVALTMAGIMAMVDFNLEEQINERLPKRQRVKDPSNEEDKKLIKLAELRRELKTLKRVPKVNRDMERIVEITNIIDGIKKG